MKKVLSLVLCLAMVLSLVLPTVVHAEDSATSGMEISKKAVANDDGSYTITLEAYGTGDKVTTTVTNEKPTDIVLVLDQSGSMAQNNMGTISFVPYEPYVQSWWGDSGDGTTNADHYERRHNGGDANLYHKVGDDYFSVSVTVSIYRNFETRDYTNSSYYSNQNNLYIKDSTGNYVKVEVERSGKPSNRRYTYTRTDTGEAITTPSPTSGANNKPTFTTPVYLLTGTDTSKNVYTYTYTDKNGVTQTIGTSTGASTEFGTTLYERVVNTNGGVSRLSALSTAVTNFANSVARKAAGPDGDINTTDDNVNHRIAMVGFASKDTSYNSWKYENTEVFVGGNTYTYGASATAQYKNAFQDMNTKAGQDNIAASISALDGYGGTFTDLGVEMANGILNANPVPSDEQRNRVMIIFTDGMPGTGDYSSTVADKAIALANNAKSNGVTVYSVGIFSGADASSAGNSNGTDTQKANYFMQKLSSNNGTVQTPSYYLSAADAATLNNIFQQISNQIQTGGSSTTLSSETVIKDIISPAFTLPTGATADNITLETYHCTGKNGNDFTWSNNNDTKGASASVNGDQVSVRGFDFAANYVGQVIENGTVTGYRGDKLVISFTVSPKTGFLGGNDVYTNTSAGVYENANATEPVITFNRPQVNVPIGDVSVTAAEKNVYLLGGVSADQIKAGLTTTVGEGENAITINLDPTVENYGLEPWQTEYVNITVSITDKSGNAVPDLANLTSNAEYEVSVTVSPKTDGSKGDGTPATAKNGSKTGKVNVFTPVVTFQDSELNLRDIPKYADENYVSVVWEHTADVEGQPVTVKSTEVSMTGNEPTLTYIYDPISGGTLTAEREVQVTEVKIDNTDVLPYTTFIRKACTFNGCGHKADSTVTTKDQTKWVNFVVHVNTFDLTITKSGVEAQDAGAPFVFNVSGNSVNMDVVVYGNGSVTIKDLPAGTYTVSEKSGYWRYTCKTSDQTVTPTSIKNGVPSVTFENTRTEDKWLDDFASATNKFINGTVERS